MFRLLKLGVTVVAFAAIAWFGVTVKLGSRTLFQHLVAIGETKESQELVDGTRQAAAPLVDDVRRRISGKPSADAGASPSGSPQERLSTSERRGLGRMIQKVDP